MKRNTIIFALVAGILLPAQAQNKYLYLKDNDPQIVEVEKLYSNTIYEEPCLTVEENVAYDFLAGMYSVESVSALQGYEDESWTITVTRDTQDTSKIWIHPICPISQLSSEFINPIYGMYDATQKSITIPLGQCIYGGENDAFYLVMAAIDNSGPILEGEIKATVDDSGDNVKIVIDQPYGVGDLIVNGWWYQAIRSATLTRTEAYVSNGTISYQLSEIDSISMSKPQLKVEDYNIMRNSLVLDFNYELLTKGRNANDRYNLQGWYNELISYKAYDEDNNLILEDYVDVYSVYGRSIDIPMNGFAFDSVSGNAFYALDDFLPCDTVLKVAFSIAPNALTWKNDTTCQYQGLESSVQAGGETTGLVINYYNERPELLSTAPLTTQLENEHSVTLLFSEEVNTLMSSMQEVTYHVYRRQNDAYSVAHTGKDFYMNVSMSKEATVTLPDSIDLQDGDIVTISYENWVVHDENLARATPFTMESGVDESGEPYGLYWIVDHRPYIKNHTAQIPATEDGRSATVTFNTNIVRTADMGKISYKIYYFTFDGLIPDQEGTITDVTVKDSTLTVVLPEGAIFDEGYYYWVVLSFEEGAVTDTNGKKMRAIDGIITEDNMLTGPWWDVDLSDDVNVDDGVFFDEEELFDWGGQFKEREKNEYNTFALSFGVKMVEDSLDLSNIVSNSIGDGTLWHTSGIVGDTTCVVPVYSFKSEISGYGQTEMLYFYDTESELSIGGTTLKGAPQAGTLNFEGVEYDVYFGEVKDGSVYAGWSFYVMDGYAHYDGSRPVLFAIINGNAKILGEFLNLIITPEGFWGNMSAPAKAYAAPVVVDGKIVNLPK